MLIAITQREVKNEYRNRDCLEQAYINYFSKFATLITIPNNPELVESYFNLPIQRIILSGGNDIGDSEKRDNTERNLLDIAIRKQIPVLGICRGMQFINFYFEGKLIKNIKEERGIEVSHIATLHDIKIMDKQAEKLLGKQIRVNSFHTRGVSSKELSNQLKPFAQSSDSIIEGLYHPSLPIAGIQWHPERESSDKEANEKIINAFLNKEVFWEK